jgi:hypothetical protein
MRKLREAGRTDRPDTITLANLRAGTNGQATVLQMTVLRRKAVPMIDYYSVAALLIAQLLSISRSLKNLIRYAVSNSRYRSIRDGDYGHVQGYVAERS